MRRGRPTTTTQTHASKPNPSPLRGINGDPFAALDSNGPVPAATDDVAARFPSLDQFSLLHDQGTKFEFSTVSSTAGPKPKDLSTRVTEKLADEAFVTPPQLKAASIPQPPTSGMSRAQKIISSSPALQEAVFVPSTNIQQPTPSRPVMVSEGTMTSPTEPPSDPLLRKYTPSPIHRYPKSDHHRSSSLPRNQGLTGSGNRNLRPDDTYLPRDTGLPVARSLQSQPISHTRHASSSRPSLEGARPSSDFLDPIARTQSEDARPRPATTYLESNIDYLRERESTASRPGFLSRQSPSHPSNAEAATADESNTEEEGNIESNVDFLRTMEDQEASRRRDRRTSGGNKQAKRSSLPSLSGTKNLLAGKFGDAFKRFENNVTAPRTPSPQALDRRELTPITGSEATDGRSDDDEVLEETNNMSPEMRRELERRRLSMEEKRVADAGAEYRRRLADRDASGAPKSIGGMTKAASIQQKVKTLLDENQKPSAMKKTAEGYGRYTDGVPLPQARPYDDRPANSYPKPTIARKPVMVGGVGSRPNPRPNTTPNIESRSPFTKPHASISTIHTATSTSAPSSLPHQSAAISSRPSAPLKPAYLNNIPVSPSNSHPASSSPPKPSTSSSSSRRIEPRPDMTPAEREDYVAVFSKRFPSLSGIEMVETVVGMDGNGNSSVKTRGT